MSDQQTRYYTHFDGDWHHVLDRNRVLSRIQCVVSDDATRIAAALIACDGADDPQPGELARYRLMLAEMSRDAGESPDVWALPNHHWRGWVVSWGEVQSRLIAMFGGTGGEEDPLGIAMTAYNALEDKLEAKDATIAAQAAEIKALREQLAQTASAYMYEDVADYENCTGFAVNDAFRIGWSMARSLYPATTTESEAE